MPKFEVIDVAQDEDRFDNLAEGLQRSVKGMLLRVGVESPEDFRGSRLLEFDGCNESEDVVPVILDDLSVDIARRGDFDLCAIPDPSALEGVKPLAFEVLDPGCIREPQQMHGPKNHLTIAVSVGRMDVAFHHIVVHKAVDHVGALPLGGTDDCRVKQQVPLVDKAVDANTFAFTEVFERMVRVEGLDLNLELLPSLEVCNTS